MESKNPVFSRQQAWGRPSPSADQLQNMYDAPAYAPPATQRPMTIDDVVVRSFMTLGTLVVAGAVSWVLNVPLGVAVVAGLVGLVLGLVASFKQSTSPVLILAYALFYGVFVGALSHFMEIRYGNNIVLQAVLGTAFAFGAVLAVHSLKIVRVTPKLVRFVMAAAIAALGLILVNLVVGFFVSGGLGLRTDSPLGWIFSVAMILLGCFFLLLDFDMIEQDVRMGAPEKFAWQAAFGLTLSLVWIYLEVLRLLSYFQGD
jgi:uncharacterized YccA/Bax inhibitor family protein